MSKIKGLSFVNDIGQVINAGDPVVLVTSGKYRKRGYKGTFRGLVGDGASIFVPEKRSYHFLPNGRKVTASVMEKLGGPTRPEGRIYSSRNWQEWRQYWREVTDWKALHAPAREVDVLSSKFSLSKLIYKIAPEVQS